MRVVRLLLVALLGFTTIGVAIESASAAGSKNLLIYHPHPIANEDFTAYGTLTTAVSRPVWLQYRYKNSGAWTTSKKITSTSGGHFEFVTHISKNRYFRYYAPRRIIDGTTYATIVGSSKLVTLATQKVEYAALSPSSVCDFDTPEITVFVDFAPAREGRIVSFVTPDATYTRAQDSKGRAVLTFTPVQGPGNYYVRATAVADDGAAAKSTAMLPFKIVSCTT